jgi:uncharacterized protein (TIGR02646 family)
MLKIEKTPEPIFFQKVRENPKVRKWEDVPPEIKKELNQHISEQEQLYNGICLCPYCERKIKVKASHIEHIRPKSKFPSLTFSYNNLMVSCNDPNTCGHYKDHSWKDTFINPVEEERVEVCSIDDVLVNIVTSKFQIASQIREG